MKVSNRNGSYAFTGQMSWEPKKSALESGQKRCKPDNGNIFKKSASNIHETGFSVPFSAASTRSGKLMTCGNFVDTFV